MLSELLPDGEDAPDIDPEVENDDDPVDLLPDDDAVLDGPLLDPDIDPDPDRKPEPIPEPDPDADVAPPDPELWEGSGTSSSSQRLADLPSPPSPPHPHTSVRGRARTVARGGHRRRASTEGEPAGSIATWAQRSDFERAAGLHASDATHMGRATKPELR